jgi:hypothetical protein
MTKPTLHDRIVSLLYWPALAVTIGTIVAPFVLVWFYISLDSMPLFIAVTAVIGLTTLLVTTDAETGKAFDGFRAYMKENWPDWTWGDRLTLKIGDVPFTICNRILWFEGVFMMILQRQDMFLLTFLGFGISGMMMILRLKHDDSWR